MYTNTCYAMLYYMACVYVYMYIHIHMCIHIYIYIYIYMPAGVLVPEVLRTRDSRAQSPNNRHWNFKAFEEHLRNHVSVCFVTEQYLYVIICLGVQALGWSGNCSSRVPD